jgi:hypothetical protein
MDNRSRRLLPLLAVLALAGPVRTLAVQRLAVLTPAAPWSGRCGEAKRTDELTERCSVLDTLADEARAGALAAVDRREVDVMTRENTAQLLKENGGLCTEGECEVETAKLLGADLVVSGNVTLVEGTWFVTMKLHAVRTAKLLHTSERIKGRTQVELIEAVRPAAQSMVRNGLDGSAMAARPVERSGAVPEERWYVGANLGAAGQGDPASGGGWKHNDTFQASLGAVFGWRKSAATALELSVFYGGTGPVERTVTGGTTQNVVQNLTWATFGAERSLYGDRMFSIAGALGIGSASLNLYSNGAGGPDTRVQEGRTSSLAGVANLELRYARRVYWAELGLTLGMTAMYLNDNIQVRALDNSSPFEITRGLIIPHLDILARIPF